MVFTKKFEIVIQSFREIQMYFRVDLSIFIFSGFKPGQPKVVTICHQLGQFFLQKSLPPQQQQQQQLQQLPLAAKKELEIAPNWPNFNKKTSNRK